MSTDIQLYSFLFLIIIIIFLAIDDGEDLDINYLTGIYERIRADEFRPDNDHVTQVVKFEQTLVGKKPTLIAPHRRLVCYCRLYEIYDIAKREKLTAHQREVYLFNDLLVVS
jgi:IQ motif/SEC7 domain-containing protein